MRDFKRGGYDRGGSRFGDRGARKSSFGGSFGRKDSGNKGERAEMHEAICVDCRKNCEVPFRPTGDKPVYCKECFDSKNSFGQSKFVGRKEFGRKNETRFSSGYSKENTGNSEVIKKIGEINSKLDILIKLLDIK